MMSKSNQMEERNCELLEELRDVRRERDEVSEVSQK